MEDISQLRKEFEEAGNKLAHPAGFASSKELQETAKRFAWLQEHIEIREEHEAATLRLRELDELLEKETDPELLTLIEEERKNALAQKKDLEDMLNEKERERREEKESIHEIIMEIRAGVGGEEAALFAQTLGRMYERFCERRGWKFRVLSATRTEIGGAKELIYEIAGKGCFAALQGESGVHRVQRIPDTEKNGRVHTSTISVAVLPKAAPMDMEIRADEIRIDVYRSSGPGGQHANKTSSAVRITHIPTGLVVQSQQARSQIENREIAMTILRSRILQQKKDAEQQGMADERRKQIGAAARSEKVRTYNFPQDRITDHRVNKNWHNITKILDGELENIVQTIQETQRVV